MSTLAIIVIGVSILSFLLSLLLFGYDLKTSRENGTCKVSFKWGYQYYLEKKALSLKKQGSTDNRNEHKKCGDCNYWDAHLQGATYNDLFKQCHAFGKVLGDCTKLGTRYPMFNYEHCAIKEGKDDT